MKIKDLVSVREYAEGYAPELHRNEAGRLTIICYNEAGYNATEIDLQDLLDTMATEPELFAREPHVPI